MEMQRGSRTECSRLHQEHPYRADFDAPAGLRWPVCDSVDVEVSDDGAIPEYHHLQSLLAA